MTGVQMIAAERARHKPEGYGAAHDARANSGAELIRMALAYASCAYWNLKQRPVDAEDDADSWWPEGRLFVSRGTTIGDLQRAGALIAAEIDRLQRLER